MKSFSRKNSLRSRSLQIETLENRELLSVSPADFDAIKAENADLNLGNEVDYNIIEITAADLSETRLNNAIRAAGVTTANDLIVLRTTAEQHTIKLSGTEIAIDIVSGYGRVTIVGFGTDKLTLDADNKSRVLNITSSTATALANLNITGGKAVGGGGIYSSSSLTITNSTISGNTATGYVTSDGDTLTGYGGGIYCYAGGTITNSTVSGNTAKRNGGGIYYNSTGGTITGKTVISGNQAELNGGGIYYSSTGGTITGATVSGNTAKQNGGGMWGNGTVTHSTVSNNTATGNGAGIYCRGDSSIKNSAVTDNIGEGIYVASGTATITN
ncbi:MAG: right-handed parallel beta-helix repeat-containing protein, partial [Planctomycetaceae bacterium]|nr:right-handed parallel beta-helix repeat-containing protein [Planctomycetaceae bacterium]